MSTQCAALSGSVDQQDRDAALQGTSAGHEPKLIFERIQTADRNQNGLALAAIGRADEICRQGFARLVGDIDHLCFRGELR